MFAPGDIAGERVTRQSAPAFVDNATAIAGLLVFGFPLSMSTIRMTLAGWALIAAAHMQLVLGHFRPQIRLLGRLRRGAQVNDCKAMRFEWSRLANTSGSRR